jgi:hypothetical protein
MGTAEDTDGVKMHLQCPGCKKWSDMLVVVEPAKKGQKKAKNKGQ